MLMLYLNTTQKQAFFLGFFALFVVFALIGYLIGKKLNKKQRQVEAYSNQHADGNGTVTGKEIQSFNRGYFFCVYADHNSIAETGKPIIDNRRYYVDPETYRNIQIGDTVTVDAEKEEILSFEHIRHTG